MKRRAILLPAVLLLGAASAPASAATATGALSVTLTLIAGCTVTGGVLDFGIRNSLAANVDASTIVSIICTGTTTYSIGMDQGLNGASVTARQLKGGLSTTDVVNYSLFSNAGRTLNWGNTVGTDTVSGTGSGLLQVLTVYGRVPPQAIPSPGVYADIVTITLTY